MYTHAHTADGRDDGHPAARGHLWGVTSGDGALVGRPIRSAVGWLVDEWAGVPPYYPTVVRAGGGRAGVEG